MYHHCPYLLSTDYSNHILNIDDICAFYEPSQNVGFTPNPEVIKLPQKFYGFMAITVIWTWAVK